MAIQKMTFLKIVGSIEDMHEVLGKLVLSENLHFDFDATDAYDNSFIIHQYETGMTSPSTFIREDNEAIEAHCSEMEKSLELLCTGLDIKPEIDTEGVRKRQYNIKYASEDMCKLMELMGSKIVDISKKRAEIKQLEQLNEKLNCIKYKDVDFESITHLNYFTYEVGALSTENRIRLRKNYENVSAVVLNIGTIKNSVEDLYMIIYPKKFADETAKLLKSMNWVKMDIPENLKGTVSQMISETSRRIKTLNDEIRILSGLLFSKKEETRILLNRIYTVVMLEKKIVELEREIVYGESSFVLNAWIKKDDRQKVEDALKEFKERIIIEEKNADEIERQVMPPTQFKNNRFFRPFENIIKLYGLPSYHEIDPTPFIAVTFCLMFGIMFGDIGQGLVYLIAGLLLYRKNTAVGQILTRLGGSSVVFGFVYGSLFGLEQAELPWLPSLTGRPLDPKNIPSILIAGVVFGVVVLTISFIFGIVNSLRKGDIEAGVFGKNGIAGYIFYISLVLSAVAVTGVIGLPLMVPVTTMLVSLLVLILKEPITNLVMGKRPLIHGELSSYLTESIFEGVETILGTLSNAISFIRVGAFALNHAGLFLAFLVMSEMMPNIVLKLIILAIGNVLILTLEGLIVFIQGLRLQYYEMFSKYFQGNGIAFRPVKLSDKDIAET